MYLVRVLFYLKLHDYKAGTPAEKAYFVELWDVGGWSAHQNSRSIFYNPAHGMSTFSPLTTFVSENALKVARRPPEICSGYLILVAGIPTWLPRNLRLSLKFV